LGRHRQPLAEIRNRLLNRRRVYWCLRNNGNIDVGAGIPRLIPRSRTRAGNTRPYAVVAFAIYKHFAPPGQGALRLRLAFDKGKQVAVEAIHMSEHEAMRPALIDFEPGDDDFRDAC
jgi:hypothetical protein